MSLGSSAHEVSPPERRDRNDGREEPEPDEPDRRGPVRIGRRHRRDYAALEPVDVH
jgi:hypothetical protein